MKPFLYVLAICLALGCQSNTSQYTPLALKNGTWRFVLELTEGAKLPFQAELTSTTSPYILTIINGEELLAVDEINLRNDSIFIRMPVFDSEFHGKIISESKITGLWYDFSRGKDYKVPFTATFGKTPRFEVTSPQSPAALPEIWEAIFSPGDTAEMYPAIGKFYQNGPTITGTFLTETGDYRFLEGVIDGNILKLSCFDGAHAFLFEATLDEGNNLEGTFWSGNHWEEPWIATANPSASIRPPEALTFLKPEYDKLAFTFPNLDGQPVSLDDPRYDGKVVIVQLMGSWCPNCMDETRLFARWYDKYEDEGLDIIALAYERSPNTETAIRNIKRLKERFNVPYSYLLASIDNDNEEAAKTLPMINHVMSFPTSIFIDREGKVRKIHTGFSGPGTGESYARFVEEYEAFIEKLLGEGQEEPIALIGH